MAQAITSPKVCNKQYQGPTLEITWLATPMIKNELIGENTALRRTGKGETHGIGTHQLRVNKVISRAEIETEIETGAAIVVIVAATAKENMMTIIEATETAKLRGLGSVTRKDGLRVTEKETKTVGIETLSAIEKGKETEINGTE